MLQERCRHAALEYEGKLYVCGGKMDTSQATQVLSSVECYDPQTNEWTMLSSMITGRYCSFHA